MKKFSRTHSREYGHEEVQLELLILRWKFSQDSLAEVRAGTIVSGARPGAGTWKEWDCGLVGQLHKTVPRLLGNEKIHC